MYKIIRLFDGYATTTAGTVNAFFEDVHIAKLAAGTLAAAGYLVYRYGSQLTFEVKP
jgi:hypothetical protein